VGATPGAASSKLRLPLRARATWFAVRRVLASPRCRRDEEVEESISLEVEALPDVPEVDGGRASSRPAAWRGGGERRAAETSSCYGGRGIGGGCVWTSSRLILSIGMRKRWRREDVQDDNAW
jgi:hypothetical protein